MKVINLWDGLLSFGAALLTAGLCGVPIWFTYRAIDLAIAPMWAWVPVVGLAFVAMLLIVNFLGKAAKGVSPSRERRR